MSQIFIDRLANGQEETIAWKLPATLLNVQEDVLFFPTEITVEGRAYLAEEFLIIQVDISTTAMVPCTVCNKMVEKQIVIDEFYHAEPLSKEKIFDFTEKLRDAILLEVPPFYECNNGNCSERKELEKFLRKEPIRSPFADL
jgi:hypothetical protein